MGLTCASTLRVGDFLLDILPSLVGEMPEEGEEWLFLDLLRFLLLPLEAEEEMEEGMSESSEACGVAAGPAS